MTKQEAIDALYEESLVQASLASSVDVIINDPDIAEKFNKMQEDSIKVCQARSRALEAACRYLSSGSEELPDEELLNDLDVLDEWLMGEQEINMPILLNGAFVNLSGLYGYNQFKSGEIEAAKSVLFLKNILMKLENELMSSLQSELTYPMDLELLEIIEILEDLLFLQVDETEDFYINGLDEHINDEDLTVVKYRLEIVDDRREALDIILNAIHESKTTSSGITINEESIRGAKETISKWANDNFYDVDNFEILGITPVLYEEEVEAINKVVNGSDMLSEFVINHD